MEYTNNKGIILLNYLMLNVWNKHTIGKSIQQQLL
jgi:hypothetical protein